MHPHTHINILNCIHITFLTINFRSFFVLVWFFNLFGFSHVHFIFDGLCVSVIKDLMFKFSFAFLPSCYSSPSSSICALNVLYFLGYLHL